MRLAPLMRALVIWALLLLVASLIVARAFELGPTHTRVLVVSDWREGKRIARRFVRAQELKPLPPTSTADEIVAEGPVLGRSQLLFGASFRPVAEGVEVSLDHRSAVLTPEELVQLGAYEPRYRLGRHTIVLGLDRDRVLAELARDLSIEPSELLLRGRFRRISLTRQHPSPLPARELNRENLHHAILSAAQHLSRALEPNGAYRYEIDTFTNQGRAGYSWPRHAGATWFLAQAAAQTRDPSLETSAKRAAQHMLHVASQRCGDKRCIGEGTRANVGSAALGLLALVELIEAGSAPEFKSAALELAEFLRSQQRPDGEFMHEFDVPRSKPIDVQRPYFTGEAALALSRMHRVTQDPRDLEAARRALDFLVYRPPWAILALYFWGSEHWTCQAMADLWTRSANDVAMRFCLDWQIYNRALMNGANPPTGAITSNPYLATRYTSSASRTEAAVATLEAARSASLPDAEVTALENGIRRTLHFLLNVQFTPGPTHLFLEPTLAYGGFPGGSLDYHVRIDYPQHAGAALLRYRKLLAESRQP